VYSNFRFLLQFLQDLFTS